MEITMTTGARYFPQFGHLAVRGEFWSGCVLAAPSCVRRLRAGRFHGALINGALINQIGTDLPVTDRMRASASEP